MLGQPQCCTNAQLNIEWKIFNEYKKKFVLYGDCTPLTYCPFCGSRLSLEPQYQTIETDAEKRICFDIDGVLAIEEGDYGSRVPYEGVVEKLNKLTDEGLSIVYQTARYMQKYNGNQEQCIWAGRSELYSWLEKYNFPLGEIYMGKCSATIYVDDKGFQLRSSKGNIDWDRLFSQLGIK